jgi:excisionase family DNA binding protein
VPFSTNKAASEIQLGKLLEKIERERIGITDPTERHRIVPIATHLEDWLADLSTNETTEKHIAQRIKCARRVIEGTKATFAKDITESGIRQSLAAIRNAPEELPSLDPTKEQYTARELARLLGVGVPSVASLVRRHRLHASGTGKARRFPRTTAEALLALRGNEKSVRTMNGFFAWMVRDKRLAENPATNISGGDEQQDRRVEYATLTADEIRQLIASTLLSTATVKVLDGQARGLLYATAITTAYRPQELARLTVEDFRLDGEVPFIRLMRTKNKKLAEQPVTSELAELLRGFLRGKEFDANVWPGMWYEKAADLIRFDLEAAKLPLSKPGPNGKTLPVSFYSLRHSAGLLAEEGGATLREVMNLMRHSDPKLTLRTYGRLQLQHLGKAIEKMPSVLPVGIDPIRHVEKHVEKHVEPAGKTCGSVRTPDETTGFRNTLKLLETEAFEDVCGDVRTGEEIPPARLERATCRLEGGCSIQLSYGGLSGCSSKRQADELPGSSSINCTKKYGSCRQNTLASIRVLQIVG